MTPVLPALALHLSLLAPATPVGARGLALSCDTCGTLLAQAALVQPDHVLQEQQRLIEARLGEVNLKLAQIDTSWPTSSVAMALFGSGLALVGIVTGAVVAGYAETGIAFIGLTVAGLALIAVGLVGVGLIVAAMYTAIPRAAAAQRERDRLMEEKMRAEAELQHLRSLVGGPR